jgi:hypothetical protein
MRSLVWLLPLGLLVVACGRTTTDSQSTDALAVSGEACATMGATAPAADGCNTCSCAEDGWVCTEEACLEPECTAGAVKDDGCNTCSCAEGGTWTCTERDCPVEPACEPGDRKDADDGCNSCHCTERGTWGCTLVYCEAPECAPPKELPADVACVAVIAYGQSPSTGACCVYPSPCHVPDDWTAYNTLEECEGTCTPGAQKTAEDGCNTCTCAEDGTWGGCTEIACPVAACSGPDEPQVQGGCFGPPAFARSESTGDCCYLSAACGETEGWVNFETQAECETWDNGQ